MDDLEISTEIPENLGPLPTTKHIDYSCTRCGREVGRDNLKAKRVQFKEMGANGPIVQTRTVAWLCVIPADDNTPSCLDRDPDYQRPRHAAAPGMAHTKLHP